MLTPQEVSGLCHAFNKKPRGLTYIDSDFLNGFKWKLLHEQYIAEVSFGTIFDFFQTRTFQKLVNYLLWAS